MPGIDEKSLGADGKPGPVVVKIRTRPEDRKRLSAHRTPPLPYDANWKPPSLQGIEHLTVRGNKLSTLLGPRITRADISQTLDEPLTITLDIWDKERQLLQSGLLDDKLRISLGGQPFAMTRVAKNGDLLTLEFEDAYVNALRQFFKPMKVTRGTMSRIQFVQKLLAEKGAPQLKHYIDSGSPGSITVEKNPLALQPHEERKPGPFESSTVKGAKATKEQLDNIRVVLGHLFEAGASKDELIVTCMTATAESRWINNKGGTGSSVGIFQQTIEGGYGNIDRLDRFASADAFYSRLKKVMANLPGQPHYIYAQAVQHSGAGKASGGASNYGPWDEESTKTVGAWNRAYGGSQSVVATGTYEFRRGGFDGSLETTWECLGRLADEVHYRRFIIEGIFYFLPDELLVGTGPRLVLSERSEGMLTPMDFDMDEGVDPQTCTFSIHTEQWYAPVGTCIEITELGPGNGVWLVNRTQGNLLQPFNQDIELIRPRAVLTEPPNDQTLDMSENVGGGRVTATGAADPTSASNAPGDSGGPIDGNPKSIIDYIAIPIASEAGVTKTIAQNDTDNHNHTHLGNASDHAGPPDYKWAADFGIGPDIRGGTNEAGAARGDAVAAALAKRFGIPWNGSGAVNATHDGFRFQMLWRYESAQAGNHYTHVHFGVRRAA